MRYTVRGSQAHFVGSSGRPHGGQARVSIVGRKAADLVIGDIQRLVDQAAQMTVAQAVDDPPPLLAGGDKPGEAQPGQMLAG